MPDQQGFCIKEWVDAKKNFENKTSKKKPSKTFLGIRRGTGLEEQIRKMDKTYDLSVRERDAGKRIKLLGDYGKEIKKFSNARKKYKEDLQKAVKGEAEESDFTKEISVLSKTLSAIESGAAANLKMKLTIEEKKRSTAPSSKEDKELAKMNDAAKNLASGLKSAVKAGSLFAAKTKADLTPDTFNQGIQSAARKLNQNVANIPKIFKTTGKTLGVDVRKAEKIANILDSWGSGKRKVPVDADEKGVVRELRLYVKILGDTKDILKNIEKAAT